MRKKYKTEPDRETGLLRIIALKDFGEVRKGDRGGLIEKEENLSQEGDCWVYYHARVSGNARVYGDAFILNNARVFGNAKVYGNAEVWDNAQIYGHAQISGNTYVRGYTKVCGNARICGYTKVCGNARICGKINVCGNTKVCGNVKLWSTDCFYINLPIKDSKDYVTLGMATGNLRFCPWSSNIEDYKDCLSSVKESYYIKNIQIIRQLYEKEV